MIKILHVVGKMDRGGTESFIMNIYRNIDFSKFQFDFVVHTNKKCSYDDEITALGGHIYHVPRFKVYNIYQYKKAWEKFFNEHNDYDIVHGHIGSSAAIYLKIAKKKGMYTIAHSHSTGSTQKNLHTFLTRFFSYKTRYVADYFLGCSKEAGLTRYGKKVASSNKFQVINNGIDIKNYLYNEMIRNKYRKELNIDDDTIVVGHVGRFTYAKNHEFLIKVFNEIIKQNPNQKYKLICVGWGELEKKIKKQIEDMNLVSNVCLLINRSDVNNILQAMDLFIFPSHYEGLGIALIEAQAAGLPCYMSDVIPNEANVTNTIKKISLKENESTWAKIIIDNYNNQCMNRSSLGELMLKSDFNIDVVVKEIEKIYEKGRNNK